MTRLQLGIFASVIVVILVFVLGFVCVIPGIFTKCSGNLPPPVPADLEIWGVFDEESFIKTALNAYKDVRPSVSVRYRKIAIDDYERELLNTFAAGQGPDILYMHNTWLPKFFDKLSPLPPSLSLLMDPIRYRDTFADVASQDFVRDGSIFALPLSIDTLALYYNRDLLASANIEKPAATWEEFLEDVERLTQRDSLGRISRSGAALGTSRNINRSVDILWMLMVQSNVPMVDLTRSAAAFTLSLQTQDGSPVSPGIRALEFYTDFANPAKRVYSWNKGMDYSLDAFAEGETAMMINYAHHLSTIQRKNPALNFSVAPIPQISTEEPAVTYPNYWGAGVKRDLPQAVEEEAWRFLLWFTDRAQSEKYLTESRRPPARRDLLDFHAGDFNLSVFSKQVLTAKSWFQIDDTATATLFADAIEDVVSGKSKPDKALRDVEAQVTLLLSEANRKGLLPKTP